MTRPSNAMRMARRAWNLLYVDAPGARRFAERALAAAQAAREPAAEGWAQLVIAIHALLYITAAGAERQLRDAERRFLLTQDRPGLILARAQMARADPSTVRCSRRRRGTADPELNFDPIDSRPQS